MKTKVSTSITITICAIFFTILYIIFASTPLTKEYSFTPEWKLDISNPVISDDVKSEPIEFSLGQNLGYFTSDGKISYFKSFPSKATISSSMFATYNTEANNVTLFNNKGEEKTVIKGNGFPFLKDDRVYLMQPGGTAYSMVDTDGSLRWTCENAIPLTALSSNKYFTISGYSNGVVKVLSNATGETLFSFIPGGSDYPVIYGADISPDGKYIATISGQSPQRFIITQRENNQTKIIYHENLDTEITRRTLVQFSKDGSKVFYNYDGGIGIFDMQTKKNFKFPINEKILQIQETDNLIVFLSNKLNNFTVHVLEKTNTKIGSFNFEAKNAFIKIHDDNLYIGKDESISKISLRRE